MEAGACRFVYPPWAKAAKADVDETTRAYKLVQQVERHADSEDLPC
jgi:hypothetical protein